MNIKSAVERSRRKRTFSKSAGMTEKRVTVRTAVSYTHLTLPTKA